jgi:hypothetical protein
MNKKDITILSVKLIIPAKDGNKPYRITCLPNIKQANVFDDIKNIIKNCTDDMIRIDYSVNLFDLVINHDGDFLNLKFGSDQPIDILSIYNNLFETLIIDVVARLKEFLTYDRLNVEAVKDMINTLHENKDHN